MTETANKSPQATAAVLCIRAVDGSRNATVGGASALSAAVPELGYLGKEDVVLKA